MSNIETGAVIDIKEIPDCVELKIEDKHLVLGAALTLTQIHESNLFPLLSQAAARVADHTMQGKITLGGNLCGTIIYRETVLPLLLADSDIVVAGPGGKKTHAINEVFNRRMQLAKGEFIAQVKIPQSFLSCPYIHVKRTKQDKINYPLVTVCAMQAEHKVRTAFSGVCGFPFRSAEMEKELNRSSSSVAKRVAKAAAMLPQPALDNLDGSCEYRQFILQSLLTSIVNELEG